MSESTPRNRLTREQDLKLFVEFKKSFIRFEAERTPRMIAATELTQLCGFAVSEAHVRAMMKATGMSWQARRQKNTTANGAGKSAKAPKIREILRVVVSTVTWLTTELGLFVPDDFARLTQHLSSKAKDQAAQNTPQ